MTQPTPAQVPPFDGAAGNPISRAEPKVRAAGLTALLSPLALYYLYEYVPGIDRLPHQLDAAIGAVLVGALTFAAGFAAKAVDRVDLFTRGEAAKVEAEVRPALVKTFGERAVDDVESWVHTIHDEVVPPLVEAAHTAVQAVESAIGAGVNPVAAVQNELPILTQAAHEAVDVAVTDGRSAGPALVAEAVSGLAAAHPALVDAVAPTIEQAAVGSNQELADMLRQMLSLLGEGDTPIADAVRAETPSAQDGRPPVPPA